jgi:transcriptional regulator with XRE-family HTH domain
MSMTTAPNDIRLKAGALDAIKAEHDIKTDQELAERLNIASATLSQVRSGRRGVGPAFIVGALEAFGIPVDKSPGSIYDIVTEVQP